MAAGFEVKAAFVREADIYTRTWPSVFPGTPTKILPLLAEGIGPQVGSVSTSTVNNDSQSSFPVIATESGGGELLVEARYSGLEFLFAAAMGFQAKRIGATVMPEDLTGGAFRHLFEIDNDLHGSGWEAGDGWIAGDAGFIAGLQKLRRGSFVIDKNVLIWETLSAMLMGLNIAGNGNAPVGISTQMVGYRTNLGTWVGNDLSALSCDTERVLYTDMTFQIGETAPLTPVETLTGITGFQLTLNNSISTIITKATGKFPDEPSRTGPVSVSGGFALPTYDGTNSRLAGNFQTGTELIALIEFEGPEIASSGFNYTLRFWLPSVKITGVSIDVGGPEQLQQNYQFEATRPSVTPDGFPTNIKNGTMMIELITDVGQHPLIT